MNYILSHFVKIKLIYPLLNTPVIFQSLYWLIKAFNARIENFVSSFHVGTSHDCIITRSAPTFLVSPTTHTRSKTSFRPANVSCTICITVCFSIRFAVTRMGSPTQPFNDCPRRRIGITCDWIICSTIAIWISTYCRAGSSFLEKAPALSAYCYTFSLTNFFHASCLISIKVHNRFQ